MRFDLLVPIKSFAFQGGSFLQHKPHCRLLLPKHAHHFLVFTRPQQETSSVAPKWDIFLGCSPLFLLLTWILGFIRHTSENPTSPPCNHSYKTWHLADPALTGEDAAQNMAPLLQVEARSLTSAEGLLLIPEEAWTLVGTAWQLLTLHKGAHCLAIRWEQSPFAPYPAWISVRTSHSCLSLAKWGSDKEPWDIRRRHGDRPKTSQGKRHANRHSLPALFSWSCSGIHSGLANPLLEIHFEYYFRRSSRQDRFSYKPLG